MSNTDIRYIAIENEADEWQRILAGYELLFHYALKPILDVGTTEEEATNIIVIRHLFNQIKIELAKYNL